MKLIFGINVFRKHFVMLTLLILVSIPSRKWSGTIFEVQKLLYYYRRRSEVMC